MTYNKAVSDARKAVGKETSNPMPEPLRQYKDQVQVVKEERDTKRLQYAYSRFFEEPKMVTKEFMRTSNYPEKATHSALNQLEKMGLIRSSIMLNSNHGKVWEIVDERNIPEGWPPKGILLTMESPYRDYVPPVRKKNHVPQVDIEHACNNPLTKMILDKDLHVEDVSSYEQLMKDTSRFYGLGEIDDLVKAIHEICKQRIEQRFIECPLCKGRIQKVGDEAHCTKCGAHIGGGTFENSMRMLRVLAKNGVKVQ